MGVLFSYSLVSGLLLLMMYLIYKWMLAGEKQYSFNRAILWTIYAVALVAPPTVGELCELRFSTPEPQITTPVVELEEGFAGPVVEAEEPFLPILLLRIYAIGAGVALALTLATALRLRAVIRSGRRERVGDYTLVIIPGEGIAPFSWLRYVVMSEKDYESSGDVVLTHELRHLESAHWIDLMLAQAVCVLQWFNPAAWLMREELKAVHEYQADEAVITSGADARSYQMLLIKKAVGARFPSIANSLNHSKLKKRVTMMYKSKSSVSGRLRALALVPAGALAILALQIPAVASAIDTASETDLTVSDSKDTKNEVPSQVKTVPLEEALDELKVVGYGYMPKNADGSQSATIRLTAELDRTADIGAIDYYVDGKKVDKESFNKMLPSDIVSIEVNKSQNPAQIRMTTVAAAGNGTAGNGPVKSDAVAGKKDVFTQVEEMPQYPGGMNEMLKFLSMNVRYPQEAMDANQEGRVVIKFVVSKTGKVENPEVIRSVSPELDAEAIRVVSAMPEWTPGKVDGEPVACYYTLPVAFKLTSTGTKEIPETAGTVN